MIIKKLKKREKKSIIIFFYLNIILRGTVHNACEQFLHVIVLVFGRNFFG